MFFVAEDRIRHRHMVAGANSACACYGLPTKTGPSGALAVNSPSDGSEGAETESITQSADCPNIE